MKLSDRDRYQIRFFYVRWRSRVGWLAERFGVSESTIYKVVRGARAA